eukprot:6192431-Pleurochrysis_carterae.AAC.1
MAVHSACARSCPRATASHPRAASHFDPPLRSLAEFWLGYSDAVRDPEMIFQQARPPACACARSSVRAHVCGCFDACVRACAPVRCRCRGGREPFHLSGGQCVGGHFGCCVCHTETPERLQAGRVQAGAPTRDRPRLALSRLTDRHRESKRDGGWDDTLYQTQASAE